MMRRILPIVLIILFALNGCSSVKEEQNTAAYKQISQEEAKELFFTLKKAGLIHKTILSWEKAWSQISDRQLLIEYIYLLTHGEMLSERISAQMAQIGSSPAGTAKCELLRKVC